MDPVVSGETVVERWTWGGLFLSLVSSVLPSPSPSSAGCIKTFNVLGALNRNGPHRLSDQGVALCEKD